MSETTATPGTPGAFGFADRVLVGAIVLGGLALRVAATSHGLSPEEVSDVEHGNLDFYLHGDEVGVNPPLLRLAFNAMFECRDTLKYGRVLSVVCGTLAPLAAAATARHAAAGWWLAGPVAAALVAFLPMGVETSGEFRAYAPFGAAAAALCAAIAKWTIGVTARGRSLAAVAVAGWAMLLPHLHYIGVPLLLGMGVALGLSAASRRLALAFIPAAVGFLPVAWVALGSTANRQTTPHGVREALLAVTSLDLTLPGAWVGFLVRESWEFGWHDAERAGVGGAVCLGLLGATVSWRRLNLTQRALLGASFGVIAGAAGFALSHHVRSPVATCLAVVLAPLLASLPALRVGLTRGILAVLVWGPVAVGLTDRWARGTAPTERDALAWFATHLHDFDRERGDAPVLLVPGITHTTLHFYLVGHSWGPHAPARACPGDPDCFELDGVRYASREPWPSAAQDALVVSTTEPPPDAMPGCTRLRAALPVVWRCGPGAAVP